MIVFEYEESHLLVLLLSSFRIHIALFPGLEHSGRIGFLWSLFSSLFSAYWQISGPLTADQQGTEIELIEGVELVYLILSSLLGLGCLTAEHLNLRVDFRMDDAWLGHLDWGAFIGSRVFNVVQIIHVEHSSGVAHADHVAIFAHVQGQAAGLYKFEFMHDLSCAGIKGFDWFVIQFVPAPSQDHVSAVLRTGQRSKHSYVYCRVNEVVQSL